MFDHFEKEKQDFLSKKDKSKKGSIDKDIVKLVGEINNRKDCYTTSSCAGRIVLLEMKSKKKNECSWIFTKHNKVTFDEIKITLKKYIDKKIKNQLWFKQQPLIIHVACKNLDSANKLLGVSGRIFKHSTIKSITHRKVTVEIVGSERIDTIIADKNFMVDDDYIKNLIKYANRNFLDNKKKGDKFLSLLKSIFAM